MTKIALMTEPTPMLANTSPSEDASSRSSFVVTAWGKSGAPEGALKAKPTRNKNTPGRKRTGFSPPAQPKTANAPAHPASQRLANRNILLWLKASASAPAGSVKRKNGSDAKLAIREMKRPDGDIRFIVQVAAVS